MRRTNREAEAAISRRSLLNGLALSGVGAALWQGLGAGAGRARAGVGPLPGSKPTTLVLAAADSEVVARTGPFQVLGAPPGSRLGVCLIVAGATHGAGPLTLVSGVGSSRLGLVGLDMLEADPGVERAAYRLLGGLDTFRPVELFGLSGEVGPDGIQAGDALEITWELGLRGGSVTTDQVRNYFDTFHAVVMGTLASNGRFTGHLSYIEVSRQG